MAVVPARQAGDHPAEQFWRNPMAKPSLVAPFLSLIIAAVVIGKGQDIGGGAGVLVASADVEAKLGKGIFTPVQNKPHVNKAPEKSVAVRAAHRSNTSNRNSNSNSANNNSGNNNSGNSGNRNSGKPVIVDAEYYNKQGDDLFDAAKYDQAATAYQQAVKMRPDYAEAYLNLGETYFNLGKYDDAIAADNQAISLKLESADAYRALGLAQLHKNNLTEAVTALKRAHELNSADPETRNALGLAYYNQGVAAYNANN